MHRILLIASAAGLIAGVAHAGGVSVAAGLASDYVVRGISYGAGSASATLDLGWHDDAGWTAGLGAASLDRDGAGRRWLLNLNGGRAWQLDADWSGALGVARLAYPGGAVRRAYDRTEFSASLDWRGRLGAVLMASPHVTRYDGAAGRRWSGPAYGLELSLRQRLAGPVALDLGLGHFELHAGGRRAYPYGSAGLAWAHGPMQAYLSRIASRAQAQGLATDARAGGRWVASLQFQF